MRPLLPAERHVLDHHQRLGAKSSFASHLIGHSIGDYDELRAIYRELMSLDLVERDETAIHASVNASGQQFANTMYRSKKKTREQREAELRQAYKESAHFSSVPGELDAEIKLQLDAEFET